MDELMRAEAALEKIDPGYLESVRSSAASLGVRGQGPDLVRDAIRDVQDLAHIDVEPPTYASQPGGRAVKNVIKRSMQWYIRYVATQINVLGEGMVTLSATIADQLDHLEESNRNLESKVDELIQRVQALESRERQAD
jgi:hypothetical protein